MIEELWRLRQKQMQMWKNDFITTITGNFYFVVISVNKKDHGEA